MAAYKRLSLLPSQTIDSDTTTASDTVALPGDAKEIIGVIEVSSRTDGTYTLTIQHSPDGTNWVDLDSASALSANGIETVSVTSTTPVFHLVRASVVSASTTSGATVQCYLMHGGR